MTTTPHPSRRAARPKTGTRLVFCFFKYVKVDLFFRIFNRFFLMACCRQGSLAQNASCATLLFFYYYSDKLNLSPTTTAATNARTRTRISILSLALYLSLSRARALSLSLSVSRSLSLSISRCSARATTRQTRGRGGAQRLFPANIWARRSRDQKSDEQVLCREWRHGPQHQLDRRRFKDGRGHAASWS